MTNIALSPAGLSVMLAMPTHRDIPPPVVISLLGTMHLLSTSGIHCDIELQCGSSRITAARSKVAHSFLKGTNSRLFWVDSDIVWKPEDFLRLLLLSTKMTVVCGAYVSKREPPTFMFDMGPTTDVQSNEFGCISINGLGLGFMVVDRTVMEQLAERSPKVVFPDIPEKAARIFREDVDRGMDRGEDMAFCADVRALGHPIWLDRTVVLGHVGQKTYTAAISDLIVPNEESQ